MDELAWMDSRSATLGILHPGEMGISLAVSAQRSGCQVLWVSEGRSSNTRSRAEKYGLVEAASLRELCERCQALVSVCPPSAAEEVAGQAAAAGFNGLYVDANAISPSRARRIGQILTSGGAAFVDGGILGGPAWQPGETWLYLSGPDADQAAACFSAGPLEVEVLGSEIGRASALKMCYAAYNKGSTALLLAVLAAASQLGVQSELFAQWERDQPGSSANFAQRARRVTAKAWRFAGEMEEIAATFEQAGLPPGFHQAAADLYASLASFKEAPALPELEQVIGALLKWDEHA
jgi:3-hydroxyisobutyrate dehydrogenase-like beta-hydroxyacid dehydrogenase